MDTWIIPVALFVALLFAWKFSTAYRSPGQLRQIAEALQHGARLVDVRTPMEFASGHLPGAVNLPVDSLAQASRQMADRGRAIVLYCASGSRSAYAAKLLRKEGHQTVLDLGPMLNGRKLPAVP